MAKLSEIIAKREELAKTNPNATNVEARQALMGTPAVPTTPTPAPALSVNQQQRADNIANRQASPIAPVTTPPPVTPVAPSPIVQPVDQTTGLSKPLAPTPDITAEQNKAISQPLSAVDQVKMDALQPKLDATPGINPTTYAQANAESEKIKAQNEAQMSINKQQSDLRQTETATANANKTAEALKTKQEQESQLASNEGAILNILRTGGIVPEAVKSSPYYQTAQQTYNKLQQYANYSTGDIVTAMNNGTILPGTTVYNEMMKDPALKQKLTDANIYRSGKPTNEVAIYETKSSEILANNPQTASMFADGLITQEEYAQATNNADIVAKAKDKEEKTNKYNTLYADYESIDDKVKSEFPGSPFADAIAADLKKAKYKDVILAKGEMDSAIGTLTDLKSQSASLFETNLGLYKDRRAEQNVLLAEQRKTQSEKDMLQYKSDFEKKQAEQALNDPATAIQTAIDEYKKLGIPFTSTVQSRLAEFKKSGLSLPDYLTQMRQNIQQSPAYKAYEQKQSGNEWSKLSETQLFNPKTGETKAINNPSSDWKLDTTTGKYYDANSSTNPSFQSIDRQSAISKYGSTPAVRNFNPGNIMDTGFGGQKVAGERFTVFSSPQEGFNALVSKIQNIQNGRSKVYSPDMTLLQYIGKYAPSSDNNNPTAYANGIAKNLGISADTKIRDIDATKLAMEHARHEDGNSYRMLQDLGVSGGVGTQTTNLSPLTQSALQSHSLTGTPTNQASQLAELQKNGLLDKGEGNANLYMAKPDVKQEFPNLISAYDSFNKAKNLIEQHKTAGDLNEMLGAYDAWQERTKNGYTPTMLRDTKFGSDFATLDNILGKELSQYMQKISGATVGDKEVERLKRQVPNLDMNETQFETAMSEYQDAITNANRYFLNQYGFSDIDTARRVLLGSQQGPAQSNTAPVKYTPQDNPLGLNL